jgi:hypothetical protein
MTLEQAVALASIKNDEMVLKLVKNGGYLKPHKIEEAQKEVAAHTKRDQFVKRLDALEVPHTFDRPPFRRVTTLETKNPKDLDELQAIPKKAQAHLSVDPWRGECTLTICRAMTEAEIAKQQAKDEAEREKQNEQWQAERAAKVEAERAAWSPEFRAWKEACAEVEHANALAQKEHDEQIRVAQLKHARNLDAKVIAKEAMIEVVNQSAEWFDLLALFGLEVEGIATYDAARQAVVKHITSSAANLVAAVGACLAWTGHEKLSEEFDAVADSVPPATLQPMPVMAGEAAVAEEAA